MQDMVEIGNMFRELGLSEMTVKDGDFEISLKKAEPVESSAKSTAADENAAEGKPGTETAAASAAQTDEPSKAGKKSGEAAEEGIRVTAPLPGIFYERENDKAEPYVKVGDSVKPDTVVCSIEAMKMLNNVKAGASGKIKKICVSAGQMVEFGQTLFLIEKE